MPTATVSPGDDSNLGFDGLSVDSQHAFATRRLVVKRDRSLIARIPERHQQTIEHSALLCHLQTAAAEPRLRGSRALGTFSGSA
jgi:hypothetical protein